MRSLRLKESSVTSGCLFGRESSRKALREPLREPLCAFLAPDCRNVPGLLED